MPKKCKNIIQNTVVYIFLKMITPLWIFFPKTWGSLELFVNIYSPKIIFLNYIIPSPKGGKLEM